ncbi:MAG: type II secretion system F family protein [Candidatus Didemnitutus sp.]|nr:type II secretion system F family protein [Candidatus Didemnitutus sp.]
MPAFHATVISPAGRRRTLRAEAADETQLRQRLRAQALWPLTIQPAAAEGKLARLRLPSREFIALLHQLELQVRAGVTADVAFGQLAEDAVGPARILLTTIHAEVAQGVPIHTACRRFGRQFPPHVAAIIAAGEASASLPQALRALAAHLTGADELRRTARRALIYPAIVLTVTGALVIFLLGGVVPKFAEIFGSLNLTLPALTRWLIAASEAVRAGWPGLAVAGICGVIAAWMATRSSRLQRMRDRTLLRVPLWGETLRCLATARFAAHTRLLLDAGVPVMEALTTGAELTGNAVLSAQLLRAREGVAAGRPLHAALVRPHSFPEFFTPALKAGETTGQLGAALQHIEDYAAARARDTLATALAWLEPALLAALTGIVGLIALSFFLPLFSLLSGVNAR